MNNSLFTRYKFITCSFQSMSTQGFPGVPKMKLPGVLILFHHLRGRAHPHYIPFPRFLGIFRLQHAQEHSLQCGADQKPHGYLLQPRGPPHPAHRYPAVPVPTWGRQAQNSGCATQPPCPTQTPPVTSVSLSLSLSEGICIAKLANSIWFPVR